MSTGFSVRHLEKFNNKFQLLQNITKFILTAMYNAAPGMFGFYGNRRPPPHVVNYASPMGFQFSPRGYRNYVQNYPLALQGPSFSHGPPPSPLQDPAIVYASRSNKRPHSQFEVTSHSQNKKRKWQEPQLFGSNSINDKITEGIWSYFESYRQTDEMYRNKIRFRNALYAIFKDVFPYCGLYIVGSSMSGFGTKTSDMDLCLMLSPQQIDGKKEAVELLIVIQRAFRKCPFIRRSQVIRARVPILKFEDANTQVECDLNINNAVGIRNTHLLKYYANMDWRVSPLVLFLKKWARFHDINDASKKTISSYSLCLMMIHYLQYGCDPPVLGCIQKLRPDLFGGKDIRDLRMTETITFESKNTDSLGDLFLGFLEYYATKFDNDQGTVVPSMVGLTSSCGHIVNCSSSTISKIFAEKIFMTDVASVRLGTKLSIDVVKRSHPVYEHNMWSCLKVEEPFDQSNTARSCYDAQTFARVIRVFKSSHRHLAQKRDLNALFRQPF